MTSEVYIDDTPEWQDIYAYFPYAVIFSIVSCSSLLLPMYAMYSRKLYFESINVAVFFFVQLTYLLHRENTRAGHPVHSTEFHDEMILNTYFHLNLLDWYLVQYVFLMIVISQSGVLMAGHDQREKDEIMWMVFLIAIVPAPLIGPWWILWITVLSIIVLPCLTLCLNRYGMNTKKPYCNYGGLITAWCLSVFAIFIHQNISNPYILPGILQFVYYISIPIFAFGLYSVVLICNVEQREWYQMEYGDFKDQHHNDDDDESFGARDGEVVGRPIEEVKVEDC